MIRYDRDSGFMPDFFRSFSKVAGQKQCTTMTYRHQTNDTSERMLQPLTRPIKMYVSDVNQKNEDGYVESLTLAFNTAQYRVRGDTVHGWDPRSTLKATLLGVVPRHVIWTEGDGDIIFSVNTCEIDRR